MRSKLNFISKIVLFFNILYKPRKPYNLYYTKENESGFEGFKIKKYNFFSGNVVVQCSQNGYVTGTINTDIDSYYKSYTEAQEQSVL